MCHGEFNAFTAFPRRYNFDELKNIIGQNEVRITNLESFISKSDCFASTFCGDNGLMQNLKF